MASAQQNGNTVEEAHSVQNLLKDLEKTDTLPLWAQMAKLNPPAPNPRCVPHVWRYDNVKPYLLRAGHLVTEKQAERRVLMLVNPNRGELSRGHFILRKISNSQ